MMGMKTSVTVKVFALAVVFFASSASANPPWPMAQGGANRLGRGTFPGPSANTVQWSYHWDGEASVTSPVVGTNGIYFTTGVATAGPDQGKALLVCVGFDGREKWRFYDNTGGVEDMNHALLSTVPAIDTASGDTVYFSTGQGTLSPFTRTVKVSSAGAFVSALGHGGDLALSTPAVSSTGAVYYCGGQAGYLSKSGSNYSAGTDRFPGGGPALTPVADTVYIGTGGVGTKRLLAVNTSNMTLKWYLEPPGAGDLYGMPLVDGNKIYFSTAHALYGVQDNGASGTLVWTRTDINAASASFGGVALGINGVLYAGEDSDGKLRALDTTTGTNKWSRTLGTGRVTAPVIDCDGYIYIGNGSTIYKLRDFGGFGGTIWSRTVTGNIQGLVLDYGTLYATTDAGNLYMIGPDPPRLVKPNIHQVGEYGGVPWQAPGTPIIPNSRMDRIKDCNLSIASVNLSDNMTSDFLSNWANLARWGRQQGKFLLPRIYFWDYDATVNPPINERVGPIVQPPEVHWNRIHTFLAAMNVEDLYGVVLAEENVPYDGHAERLTYLYNQIKACYPSLPVWQWWSPVSTVPTYNVPADGWIINNYDQPNPDFRRHVQRHLATGVPVVVMYNACWIDGDPDFGTASWVPARWQALEDEYQVCREYNLATAPYWVMNGGASFGLNTNTYMDQINNRVLQWITETKTCAVNYSGLASADNATGDNITIGPDHGGEYCWRDSFLDSTFILNADLTGFRHLVWEPERTLALRSWNGTAPAASLTYKFASDNDTHYPRARVSVPYLDPGSTVSLALSADNGTTWPCSVVSSGTPGQTLAVSSQAYPQFAGLRNFRVRVTMTGTRTDGEQTARIDDLFVETGSHDYTFFEDFDNGTWRTRPQFAGKTENTPGTLIRENFDNASQVEFLNNGSSPNTTWASYTYRLSNEPAVLGDPVIYLAGRSNAIPTLGYGDYRIVVTADNDTNRQFTSGPIYNHLDNVSQVTAVINLSDDSRFDNFTVLNVTVCACVFYPHGWPDFTTDTLWVTAQSVGQVMPDLADVLLAMDAVPGDAQWNAAADVDGDGEITSSDLSIVLGNMD